MTSTSQMVQRYHDAETAAASALKAAQELQFDIGMGKTPTAEQKAKMERLLNDAFAQGHEAEKWRGSYLTTYHAEDPNGADLGHLDAINFINTNVMEPTQNLANLMKIQLRNV